jgi:hypothetical protein
MKKTLWVAPILAATIGLVLAVSAAAAPRAPFTVTSTLDGKKVLPRHIHWYASAPAATLVRVDFLIDGKLRWIQHKTPYIYGDQSDDHGKVDRGYLVTSWLTQGLHRFTVKATAADSRVASDTVVARVLHAVEPPPALAGTWRRVVDPTGAPKLGSPGAPADTPTPAGTYTLVFDKRWLQTRNPGKFTHASVDTNTGLGYIQDTDYLPGPRTFRVWGAVSWRPFSDYLAEEGTWCLPWGGPQASYGWSVTGDTLTLKPVGGSEPCRVREFIWTGEWTRVT